MHDGCEVQTNVHVNVNVLAHVCACFWVYVFACTWVQACIKTSIPFPDGSNKIKGFGDGEQIKSLKNRKEKIFEDLTLLVVPKGNI